MLRQSAPPSHHRSIRRQQRSSREVLGHVETRVKETKRGRPVPPQTRLQKSPLSRTRAPSAPKRNRQKRHGIAHASHICASAVAGPGKPTQPNSDACTHSQFFWPVRTSLLPLENFTLQAAVASVWLCAAQSLRSAAAVPSALLRLRFASFRASGAAALTSDRASPW